MRGKRDMLDAGVAAFRGATGRATDGRATRARVLTAARRQAVASRHVRRVGLVGLVALVVVSSGAAAWTAVGRWRAAAGLTTANEPMSAGSLTPRNPAAEPSTARPTVQSVVPAPARPANTASEEERVYGRAHEAHFEGRDPRAALAAWNLYLRRYPGGTFAPEAQYNRAVALLRLGRVEAALIALRPFAAGAFGDYRRAEATTLISAATRSASGQVAAEAVDVR